jgi:hypothetical protein
MNKKNGRTDKQHDHVKTPIQHTPNPDPLKGWFSLGRDALARPQRKTWRKGGAR